MCVREHSWVVSSRDIYSVCDGDVARQTQLGRIYHNLKIINTIQYQLWYLQFGPRNGRDKKIWSRPGSNWGPSACKADVITTTPQDQAHHTRLKDLSDHPFGEKFWEKKFGDGGYRSPYLSHAKRALYHLSYVPSCCWVGSNKQGLADRQVAITPQLIRSISAFCNNNAYHTFDSSVGRAVDCSCELSEIHRSLVQIRLEGVLLFHKFLLVFPMCPGSSVGRALGF